jgi:hypothetical protein
MKKALNWFGRMWRFIFSLGHVAVVSDAELEDAELRLRGLEARVAASRYRSRPGQ